MKIRSAELADTRTIADFNAAMALETEGVELQRERVTAGVESLLRDEAKGFYLIADRDGDAVGQMMLTYEWSDWRNGTFWWIQSVYVRQEDRRTGIYRALYARAVDLAKERGACGLRLYVERENTGARQTYEDLGMSRTVYEMYEVDFVLQR